MATRVSHNTRVPQRTIAARSQNLLAVLAVVANQSRRRVVACPELEQPGSRRRRVKQPLLRVNFTVLYSPVLTFTLLSALEEIRRGWPCTHSRPVTPCSWAVRVMWITVPPLLRSHMAIAPADDDDARTAGPSMRNERPVMEPSSILICMTHSSDEISRTRIVPSRYPIPTTSSAGDWTRIVTGEGDAGVGLGNV